MLRLSDTRLRVERIRKGRHLKDNSVLERLKKKLKKEDRPVFTPFEDIDLT
jgi:hypothetical protein